MAVRTRSAVLAFTILAATATSLTAQGRPSRADVRVAGPSEVQEITLEDGSELIGRVVEVGPVVTIELVSGVEVAVPRSRIVELRTARGQVVDGRFRRTDPNRTRLFFGPTGRNLERGSGYVAMYEVVMPFVAVAPSGRVLLAGGTPLFFGDDSPRLVWLAPKVQLIRQETFQLAVGALAFWVLGEEGSAGIAYAVGTKGTPDRALSVGVGYGRVDGSLADRPAIMLGGEVRASNRVKLITENYVIPMDDESVVLLALGPRFIGSGLTADLGLAVAVADGETFGFPLVNFVWNF